MSMETIQARLLADTLPKVEDACRSGRGEALLFDYYRKQAEIVADSVFLQLTQAAADPSIGDGNLIDHMERFAEARGLLHLQGVVETCVAFGMPVEHQARAETISADAFRERLNLHFASTGWGGTA